jgi:hypothetical protein
MLITKEHQEALIENYRKKGRNEFECMGFVEGLNEMLNLIDKKIKQKQNENTIPNKNRARTTRSLKEVEREVRHKR